MKIAVITPVFCEGKRAAKTIKGILKYSKGIVIAVDDGSSDGSYELLVKGFGKNPRVWVLRHVINLGKGAAMKTGVKMAWKLKMKAVIFIDADGQHNPKYLPEFEKSLKTQKIVFGYRQTDLMPFIRKWGNLIAKKIVGVLFNLRRKEFLCGFMGFRLSIYPQIRWTSKRYGIETEIATLVGKKRLPFSEVKIDTIYIDKYKGVTLFDALKILVYIPVWYFRK